MRRDSLWLVALLLVFLIGPVVLLANTPIDPDVDSWLGIGLLSAAVPIGIAGMLLFATALLLGLRKTGGRKRITELESEGRLTAEGAGLLVVFVTLVMFVNYPALAGFYVALALAYALWCLPYSTRRIDYRLTIVVRSSPEDAFALVSDPRNWNRYLPELTVDAPLEVPLHVGSIVRDTWTEGRRVLTEDEVVIAFEPGRRFGTASVHRRPTDGIYELTPVEGGTEIAWTYSSVLPYSQAVLGGVLRRRALLARVTERRRKSLVAIKRLLEEPVPLAV